MKKSERSKDGGSERGVPSFSCNSSQILDVEIRPLSSPSSSQLLRTVRHSFIIAYVVLMQAASV